MKLGSSNSRLGSRISRTGHAGSAAVLSASLALVAAQAVNMTALADADPPEPIQDPLSELWNAPELQTIHESSNMVLTQTIGMVPEFGFTPLFFEWLGTHEEDLSADSLFTMSATEPTPGMVGSAVLFGEDIHFFTFEPTTEMSVLTDLDTVIQPHLNQLGYANHELSLVRAGVVPVIASGSAGVLDDVWLLVSQWSGTLIGESSLTIIYPFFPDPLEIVEGHPIFIPILIGIGTGALVTGVGTGIGYVINREKDRRRCNKDRNRQLAGCLTRCGPLRILACENVPEGVICPVVARCNACCREIYRRHDLQGICSTHIPINWGPLDQDYNDCWQNADNPNYPLPGDPPGSNGAGGGNNP